MKVVEALKDAVGKGYTDIFTEHGRSTAQVLSVDLSDNTVMLYDGNQYVMDIGSIIGVGVHSDGNQRIKVEDGGSDE